MPTINIWVIENSGAIFICKIMVSIISAIISASIDAFSVIELAFLDKYPKSMNVRAVTPILVGVKTTPINRHVINSKLKSIPSKKPKLNGIIIPNIVGNKDFLSAALSSLGSVSLYPDIKRRKITPSFAKNFICSFSGHIKNTELKKSPADISPNILENPIRSNTSPNIFAVNKINSI